MIKHYFGEPHKLITFAWNYEYKIIKPCKKQFRVKNNYFRLCEAIVSFNKCHSVLSIGLKLFAFVIFNDMLKQNNLSDLFLSNECPSLNTVNLFAAVHIY